MPAIQSRRPSSGEGNELLGDLLGGIRPGEPEHRLRDVGEPAWVVEQRADQLGRSPRLALRHDDRAASVLKVAGVLGLVVTRGEEAGNENGGLPRRREFPDRAPRTRKCEIAGAERGAELFRESEEAVIRAEDLRAQLVVVAG